MPRGGPTAGEGPPGMRTTGPGAVFAFNPVYAVELEPEGQRWSPAEAARFLAATAADPLGLMFRLVVLRGFRRGEAAGQRWAGAHLDDGYLTVDRTILQIGGMVAGGNPKSKAGERRIWLGSGTVALLKAHRRSLLADQLRASSAWADNDLIFCHHRKGSGVHHVALFFEGSVWHARLEHGVVRQSWDEFVSIYDIAAGEEEVWALSNRGRDRAAVVRLNIRTGAETP